MTVIGQDFQVIENRLTYLPLVLRDFWN